MPQGKRWTLAEETCLAKAYLAATMNPYRGTDQTGDDFNKGLIEKYKGLSPEYAEDGRFHHRSDTGILEELRRLKADVQSFNKALNIIWASSPTGCTEVEKTAMAVAIHCKVTKRMDYHFKNFDVNNWKFFGAWNVLKNTAKFQFHPFVGNNNNTNDCAATPMDAEAASENDKENNSPLVPTVLMDASNAKSSFVGKKGSEEKRRREKMEKEREATREERHAKILASLEESKSYLARISAVNELSKKRNSSVFTLATTVFALRGNTDPDAVAVVNDCVTLLIKKARATIDEDAALGSSTTQPSENTGGEHETPTYSEASPPSESGSDSESEIIGV
jgi:hypothetical protein